MVISGIVSEYNPFHKGHAYHIAKTREVSSGVAVVMSGHFVQRGDVSVFDKWSRTRCALLGGADLVLELPLPWAMAPAETFARGALGVLGGLSVVKSLSFGSESGDVAAVKAAAFAVKSPEVSQRCKEFLQSGITYAAARENAVRAIFGDETANVVACPNDTLATEYISEINRQGLSIKPYAVKRTGQAHDGRGTSEEVLCASQIRSMLRNGGEDINRFLPSGNEPTQNTDTKNPVFLRDIDAAVVSRLRFLPKEAFSALPDISEGLENRIFSAVRKCSAFEDICQFAKTKRYTLARIRRIVLSAALNLTDCSCEGIPPYIRVLGLNARGREILREAKAKAQIPLVMKYSDVLRLDARAQKIFALESAATDLYALAFGGECGLEMTTSPVVLI